MGENMTTNFFFTSDTHFGHTNIIKYANRPFKDIDEMDNEIIRRWNSVVGKRDIVFHLGDFMLSNKKKFEDYFYALNGKIVLIKGNHDDQAYKNRDKFELFCPGYYEAKINSRMIVLCHYAMIVWNKSFHNSWHLFGHSHANLPNNEYSLSFDCGVDTHNFYPYSFYEVETIMAKKNPIPAENVDENIIFEE